MGTEIILSPCKPLTLNDCNEINGELRDGRKGVLSRQVAVYILLKKYVLALY